jgi:hypothetical protein
MATAVGGRQAGLLAAPSLHEMINLAKDNPYPIIIGGISTCLDSHSRRAKAGLMIIGLSYIFNTVIDRLDLREVSMVWRHVTW